MTEEAQADRERTRRFRDAALPHLDATYSYARMLTRNESDAEDAVQECYLLALRHFDGFRGGSMKAWLHTILKNVCYRDFAKRARRGPSVEFSEEEEAFAAGSLWQETQGTPEAILQRREDDAAVRRLIDTLPAPFREVLVLRELQDLSYQEIAQIAGAPVGTVMSRLARARARLREMWINARADETPALAGSARTLLSGLHEVADLQRPRELARPARSPRQDVARLRGVEQDA